MPGKPLGAYLTEAGIITKEQLEAALPEARATGELLGEVLIRMGFTSADDLSVALAEQAGIPRVDLGQHKPDPEMAALIPEAFVPERLDQQLADRTKAFLDDKERGLHVEGGILWASKIFDWYAKDFLSAGGLFQRLTAEKLLDVLGPYLPDNAANAKGQSLTLKFPNYDWSLNAQRQ